MEIYGLKNCDKCRAARKALPGAIFVDVREAGMPPEVLQTALDAFGDALVNKKSTTWRGLSEAERATAAKDLLTANPVLMTRPLIVDGSALHLGWTADVRSALGL